MRHAVLPLACTPDQRNHPHVLDSARIIAGNMGTDFPSVEASGGPEKCPTCSLAWLFVQLDACEGHQHDVRSSRTLVPTPTALTRLLLFGRNEVVAMDVSC